MDLGDLALVQRQQRDAGKVQPLVDAGNILLVTRHAIEIFGDQHGEAPGLGVGDELLNRRSVQDAGAGDPCIAVDLDDIEAEVRRAGAAQADLILDRGRALQVGVGETGVDGGALHHDSFAISAAS